MRKWQNSSSRDTPSAQEKQKKAAPKGRGGGQVLRHPGVLHIMIRDWERERSGRRERAWPTRRGSWGDPIPRPLQQWGTQEPRGSVSRVVFAGSHADPCGRARFEPRTWLSRPDSPSDSVRSVHLVQFEVQHWPFPRLCHYSVVEPAILRD